MCVCVCVQGQICTHMFHNKHRDRRSLCILHNYLTVCILTPVCDKHELSFVFQHAVKTHNMQYMFRDIIPYLRTNTYFRY